MDVSQFVYMHLRFQCNSSSTQVPDVFSKILQPNNLLLSIQMESSSKDGLTIICSKRGGDVYSKSHSEWLNQVSKAPDAIFSNLSPSRLFLQGFKAVGILAMQSIYIFVTNLQQWIYSIFWSSKFPVNGHQCLMNWLLDLREESHPSLHCSSVFGVPSSL